MEGKKNYQIWEKTIKGHFKDLGAVFSMMTASDKEVTRQNLKECWKIKACKGADDKVGQRSKGKEYIWCRGNYIPEK